MAFLLCVRYNKTVKKSEEKEKRMCLQNAESERAGDEKQRFFCPWHRKKSRRGAGSAKSTEETYEEKTVCRIALPFHDGGAVALCRMGGGAGAQALCVRV